MYREPSGHPLRMIIMWLDDSNSSVLRLWPSLLGMIHWYVHWWNDPVCEKLTTAIVEAAKDKYCGLQQLTGSADGGISPKPLLSATWAMSLQLKHVHSQIQPAGLGPLSYHHLNSTEEADSTLQSFTSECVRRCLLKAVRKSVDGCT